jgi:hypothetical protein
VTVALNESLKALTKTIDDAFSGRDWVSHDSAWKQLSETLKEIDARLTALEAEPEDFDDSKVLEELL